MDQGAFDRWMGINIAGVVVIIAVVVLLSLLVQLVRVIDFHVKQICITLKDIIDNTAAHPADYPDGYRRGCGSR